MERTVRASHLQASASLCTPVAVVAFALCTASGNAAVYDIRAWAQRGMDKYAAQYAGNPTDLFGRRDNQRLTYSDLVPRGRRGEVVFRDNVAYDRHHPNTSRNRLPAAYRNFTQADYTAIVNGDWHCSPTSAAMIHNYWHRNRLDEVSTISAFARDFDTNDVNAMMNRADHEMHYGTYIKDISPGVRLYAPGSTWGGPYRSTQYNFRGGATPTYPSDSRLQALMGELRAGRPFLVDIPGHTMVARDWHANAFITVDPWTAGQGQAPWVQGHVDAIVGAYTMQPRKVNYNAPGDAVYFSNDTFGTGQANAQAIGGDPGDIFGSDLRTNYGRKLDDVGSRMSRRSASHPDYFEGQVTSGVEHPFNLTDFDRHATRVFINQTRYSLDQGDPNPHGWSPHIQAGGDPREEPLEFQTGAFSKPTAAPYNTKDYYTWGGRRGHLMPAASGTEHEMGLDRFESQMGNGRLLDDDIDGLEFENFGNLYYTVNYVDTDVWPEYPATTGLMNPPGREHWHQLAGYDPTDIYFLSAALGPMTFVDGEHTILLHTGVHIDAMQFVMFTDTDAPRPDGLFFSIDAEAPSRKDASGRDLDPGMIYFSPLDSRTLPIPTGMAYGFDIDAIKMVPTPGTLALLLALLSAARRRRIA